MGKIRDILRTMEYGPSPESNDHVVAWLDNEPVRDKETLAMPVKAESELYLFQALSGG